MKKFVCIVLSMLICISLAVPAFAAEGEFVPSISYKDGPELISAYMDDVDVSDCIVITSIEQARDRSTDIKQEERDLLLDVYRKLDKGSMTLPLNCDYVIRDLVDISFEYEDCRELADHNNKDQWLQKKGNTITLTVDLNIGKHAKLDVLAYVNGTWTPIEKVTNNGNGTVTLVFEDICPVAFVLKDCDYDPPKTGDVMGQNLGLWIALMAAAVVGLVAVVIIGRKKK